MADTAFSSAFNELNHLLTQLVQLLPLFAISLLVIVTSFYLAKTTRWVSERALRYSIRTTLLRRLLSQIIAIVAFLAGFYLALRLSGLTQLAVTVLGGTGIAGLIFGFAFRDIAENFLASIILIIQRPFKVGDVIEVSGHTGLVERMTIRCTILMNFDGDHIQIPNATIFKSVIRNLTANPNQRGTFQVGIGYDAQIAEAQEKAMLVLQNHSAVLDEPEPWVLVDNLGASTINLKLFFWVNICENNLLKVKSVLMRQVASVFLESGISMPDEAREIIVPQGIMVTVREEHAEREVKTEKRPALKAETTQEATKGEGDLKSDHKDIQDQLINSPTPDEGQNLLS